MTSKRSLHAVAAPVAAAVAVAATVAGVAAARPDATARTTAGDFSAAAGGQDTLSAAISNSADLAIAPDRWSRATVEALGGLDEVLQGQDQSAVVRWRGIFSDGADQELRIIAINEDPMSDEAAKADCETRLKYGYATSCEVTSADNAVIQTIERGAHKDPEGWPVAPVAVDPSAGLDKNLWLMQQVIVRNASGTTVYAQEVTRANTWEEARSGWRLTRSDLEGVAGSVYASAVKNLQ